MLMHPKLNVYVYESWAIIVVIIIMIIVIE